MYPPTFMTEHDLIKALHRKIDNRTYKVWKICDQYQGGVPDAMYKRRKHNGPLLWVEYKYIKSWPKRESTILKPNLSELQKEWLDDLYKSSKKCAVVIGVEKDVVVLHNPGQWRHGITCADARKSSLTRNEYIAWLQSVLDLGGNYANPTKHHIIRHEESKTHATTVELEKE